MGHVNMQESRSEYSLTVSGSNTKEFCSPSFHKICCLPIHPWRIHTCHYLIDLTVEIQMEPIVYNLLSLVSDTSITVRGLGIGVMC